MKRNIKAPGFSYSRACLVTFAMILLLSACRKLDRLNPLLKHFDQVNLVDNNGEYNATHTDPQQINAWGIAFSPNGIAWVNSQGGHVSALYDQEGATIRPPINIPAPGGGMGGNPTGIVFNGTADFILSKGGPGRFIFVGVDGVLSAWNGEFGGDATLLQDNSSTSSYTGLTLAQNEGENYLYAADFRAGKIVVWNKNFEPVSMPFLDPRLPSGYSPFNIERVGDWLYVLYAKVGPDGKDEKGQGLGYVSIFKTNGDFVERFASKGALNAPWGIAKAPATFFKDTQQEWEDGEENKHKNSSIILIGNFGNGYINAYTEDGHLLGPLKARGLPIKIDGLWAITFPPATATAIDPNRLYFAAGPDEEKDGLFGYIIKK